MQASDYKDFCLTPVKELNDMNDLQIHFCHNPINEFGKNQSFITDS